MDTEPKDEPSKWSPAGILVWIVWALTFVALEWNGLRHNGDSWPPLTQVVAWGVWAPVTLTGIVWLFWHFVSTYRNKK